MYDPSEALLQLGLYDYVWGDPTMLNTYNSNVQAQKAREEQARYNMLWKQIEERNAKTKEKESYNKELKEASVEMAKLNKDLINAKPQEAVIIQKQQEALAAKYPELKNSTADAIAARKAEENYQNYKTNFIGKLPNTYGKNTDIESTVKLIMDDPELRADDKESLVRDVRGKKSTEQQISEAVQSTIASHSGKKTETKLNDAELKTKAEAAITSNSSPSSLSDEVKSKIRELGYTWKGMKWVPRNK